MSADGAKLYVSNEDVATASAVDVRSGKVEAIVRVKKEPEGMALTPDGKLWRPAGRSQAFVLSQTAGTLTGVDTVSHRPLRTIKLPDGSRPMGTAMAADGMHLYVSTGRTGTGCVVDPHAGAVLHAIPVGERPWGRHRPGQVAGSTSGARDVS